MLERVKNGEKVEVDESLMFGNINAAIIDMAAFIELMKYNDFENTAISVLSNMFPGTKQRYNLLREKNDQDITEYIQIVDDFINLINMVDTEEVRFGNYLLRKEDFSSIWCYGNFVFQPEVLQKIMSKIEKKAPFNLLDMNCADCENLIYLGENYPYINLYGISARPELDIPPETRKRIRRLILGGIKNVSISNDSFDAVIATPKISLSAYEDINKLIPEEDRYLERSFNYLRKDGLLILPIPKCAITRSIATFLAKNLQDISIMTDKNLPHDTVIIMGTKKGAWNRELDPKVFAFIRNIIISPEILKKQGDIFYSLPDNAIDVRIFRGGTLDKGEMNLLFSMSNIMKEFWKKQKVKKITDRAIRPLLPFSVGQLGLVLTSGCLDGVIEESDHCSHVVKGRVIKVIDTEQEIKDDQLEVSSTTSNRVEISIFLPDGTYRRLI